MQPLESWEPMAFTLQTLGKLCLRDKDGGIVSYPEKGLLLLCYLLVTGVTEKSRSRIAATLWDDADGAKVLANLRQTASRILVRQSEIGADILMFSATEVQVNREVVRCDLDLLDLTKPKSGRSPLEALAATLAVLKEEFLGELLVLPKAIKALADQTRREHSGYLVGLIRAALPVARRRNDIALIKDASLRLLRDGQYTQEVQQILMASYEAEGDLGNARQIFERRKQGGSQGSPIEADLQALSDVRRIFASSAVADSRIPIGSTLPRLAILPPPMIGGGGQHQVANAFIEDITICLCTSKAIKIVAPHTAQQISRQANRAELISRHSITYILDTALSAAGGDLVFFVQLINFATDEVIWADRFQILPASLDRQRRDISRRVAASISSSVSSNEISRHYFESSPSAYYAYLQGQGQLQHHLTLPEIRRARRHFKTALIEKPGFSPALSGMARTNHLEWLITARGDTQLLRLAEQQATDAIAAGHDLTAGYRELGVSRLFLGAFDDSVEALRMAETLSPQYADVIADYGDTLIHASRPAEGLAKLEEAMELNPVVPDGYLWAAAGANYYLENYSGALDYIGRMTDPDPAARLAAASAAMAGDNRSARTLMKKARDIHPDFVVDNWISVLPIKEEWQRDHYRQGLKKAGF